MMKKLHFCSVLTLASVIAGAGLIKAEAVTPAGHSPNYLIIMADDCTFNDLPIYGGKNAQTPNLDLLASQGLVFNRAYVAEAICAPSRSELYTGQFPVRNGCAWNHSASRNTTRSVPEYLGALGYRVGISGKVDVSPRKNFPFESVPGFDGNCVGNPTKKHSLAGVHTFITRKQDQPFCLVVALVEPHVPWVMGDSSKYPPGQIKLPDNIADTPTTRSDYAKYLAEITYMDGQVGEILGALKDSGLEDNTLVLFTSEQGSQFPGNKWTCWDTGLHTGLIARWPGKVPVGKRTDAVVQYADVTPTLLALAGGDPLEKSGKLDGSNFSEVLLGKTDKHRMLAYGILNNIPEGAPYPSRTVTDGQWRYIRNLMPNELFLQNYIMGSHGSPERDKLNNPYWGTWVASSGDAQTYQLIKRYMMRPPEELYNTAVDHYEMKNLAADPECAGIKTRLSGELDRWMKAQGDPGAAMDTQKAFQAAKEGIHEFTSPSQP